jgi:hypothetical protein
VLGYAEGEADSSEELPAPDAATTPIEEDEPADGSEFSGENASTEDADALPLRQPPTGAEQQLEPE